MREIKTKYWVIVEGNANTKRGPNTDWKNARVVYASRSMWQTFAAWLTGSIHYGDGVCISLITTTHITSIGMMDLFWYFRRDRADLVMGDEDYSMWAVDDYARKAADSDVREISDGKPYGAWHITHHKRRSKTNVKRNG